jgi:starch-binding outer membrane protein, SusD/RagB family
MKKFITIYVLIGCLMLPMACNNPLDIAPVSDITSASYWKSEGDVTGYVTGIYFVFRHVMNSTYYFEDRSDAFVAGIEGPVSVAWAQNLTDSNAPNWEEFYNIVHHCNLVIKYAPGIGNTAKIRRSIAQAYFLRAYTYFLMVKSWGDVPIVLEPTESGNRVMPSRSPAPEVMNLILNDIALAIAAFPEPGFVNKSQASMPAALSLKADALLWKYKVLQGTQEDLQNAIAAVDQALASGVSLLQNFADIHATNKKKNAEIIFSLHFQRKEKSDQYGSRLKPRDIFVDKASNKTAIPYARNGARSAYAPSAKAQAMFAANDARKAVSIITAVDAANNVIGVFDNKFRGTAYEDDRYWENDIVIYRAAELVLFRAEALAALDMVPEAIAELDKIRLRAGTGNYAGAADKQAVEKEILDERFRELWFELKRWPDLVRFHYGGTINVYNEVPNLNGKDVPLFFPIPKIQIAINPNLAQTTGYPQ